MAQYVAERELIYYGVDCHEPSLEYAQKHYGSPSTHFLENTPRDVKFDVMVFADVLEHLVRPAGELRQLIQKYPNSDSVQLAKDRLTAMGVSATERPAPTRRGGR
mgnify:CR=1 FL=1